MIHTQLLPAEEARLLLVNSELAHLLGARDEGYHFWLATEQDRVVGAAKIILPGAGGANLHLENIEVLHEYRSNGVATALLQAIYEMAKQQHVTLTTNGFSEAGRSHLSRMMERFSKDTDVPTATIGRV